MTPQEQATKTWLLARLRTIRAGISLIIGQVDEIGIDLTNDDITAEQAAYELNCLETMPVHFAGHIFTPVDDTAAGVIERWEETDEAKPRKPAKPSKPEYRTPQTTINAFWHVVSRDDQPYLLQWLAEHPKDAVYLEKLLEEKCQAKSR